MNVIEVSLSECEEEDDKTRQKSRKTSSLWNFFTPISRDLALCELCQHKFSYKTSTSNLRKHILCKHKDKIQRIAGDKRSKQVGNEQIHPVESDDMPAQERVTVKKEKIIKKIEPTRSSLSSYLSFNKSWDREKENDEYEAYGITVAAKLRKMDERQRLFCERIINEALFKGALEQLTPVSDIVICIDSSS